MSEERKRLRRGERAERVAKGQCPDCGDEAAPYLKCWACRLKPRLDRSLARGVKSGAVRTDMMGRYFLGDRSEAADREWNKWGTSLHLAESDGRGKPRLRGVRVDVDATLVEVMKHIGRPCMIEEITAAWGRLRAKRVDPLAGDLGRLIIADAKRARKMAKHARPS